MVLQLQVLLVFGNIYFRPEPRVFTIDHSFDKLHGRTGRFHGYPEVMAAATKHVTLDVNYLVPL